MNDFILPLIAFGLAAVLMVVLKGASKIGEETSLLIRTLWPVIAVVLIGAIVLTYRHFYTEMPDVMIGVVGFLAATVAISVAPLFGNSLRIEYEERAKANEKFSPAQRRCWQFSFYYFSVFTMLPYWWLHIRRKP